MLADGEGARKSVEKRIAKISGQGSAKKTATVNMERAK
jgi:hypothetical protein